ncbi:MAG: hypothetical protein WBM50_22570 [Acidimicrobiales bacterium]
MYAYRNPKLTAMVSAIGFVSSLVLVFAVSDVWPWVRIGLGVVALLLAVKVAVAWRADRPGVTHFEEVLRRLAFVDRTSNRTLPPE